MQTSIEPADFTVFAIHLADNEWGNELMVEIARITFDKFRGDKSRLLVEVYEHAGWFLSFAFIDGNVRCVSSANDAARFGEEVKEFWRRYNTEKNKKFVNIRRGEDT